MARPARSPTAVNVEKVSVSLRTDELRWVKARAKLLRKSVSSVLSDAVALQQQLEARRDVLTWLREKNPPPTAAELRAIEREWKG
jgi:hypothetical protein